MLPKLLLPGRKIQISHSFGAKKILRVVATVSRSLAQTFLFREIFCGWP